jgi:hypothetical protein
MSTHKDRLSSIGDMLTEVARNLDGVGDILCAPQRVAADDRITPGMLELLYAAVRTAADELDQLSDIAIKEGVPA